MSVVRVAPEALRALHDHAARRAPEEACGLLLGDPGLGSWIRSYHPATNVASDPVGRFAIGPEDLLAAEREARELGLAVVGLFHSHPGGPARPSGRDEEFARLWGDRLWAIRGSDGDLGVFRRAPAGGGLERVPVVSSAAS